MAMEAAAPLCCAIFVFDLAPGLTREDLRQIFGHYGDITTLDQATASNEEMVFVEYASSESAQEAQCMLNHAAVRHQTCRCLLADHLDVVRKTMASGHRLIIENLDPAIESPGLLDICSLFGTVLDCKVQLDEEEKSRGYGFAHFADEADAAKAKLFVDGSQVGESAVEVRAFEAKDAALFTGCSFGSTGASARENENEAAGGDLAKDLDATTGPAEREKRWQESFEALQTHHLEVIDDLPEKLERLKALTQSYNPNQEQQMVVIANSSNLVDIGALMGEMIEEADFDTVSTKTSKEDRKEAIDGFETGNTFALLLASDVAVRHDFDLTAHPSVLVIFDFPSTLQAYFQRIFKRADTTTRVHAFFSCEADNKLAVSLLAAMEQAGHEIPPGLVECWTGADDAES